MKGNQFKIEWPVVEGRRGGKKAQPNCNTVTKRCVLGETGTNDRLVCSVVEFKD